MSRRPHRSTFRVRRTGALAACAGTMLVLATAVTVAVPLAATAAAEAPRSGVLDLAPLEAVTPESTTTVTQPGGGASLTPDAESTGEQPAAGTPATPADATGATDATESADPLAAPTADDDLDRPLGQLRELRDAVAAERDALQVRVLAFEATRTRAEERLDRASDALAAQLVARFEADDQARVQALIDIRDEGDPERRAALLAAMHVQDREIITELDAATAAVAAAASKADAARNALRTLSLRVSAIDAVIEDRRPRTKRERDRERGTSYSVDADLVFTTGAIPGIGYWGASTGGGMLTGWTGFAGAALGGVGCTPPEPGLQASGSIETGEASWYGPGFHGNTTANGETYDQNAMTAAHKTLPFGSVVRVLSSATGKCAFVRINDRGPYIDGRIIDLSHAAATQIGMSGVAPVQIEVWSTPS